MVRKLALAVSLALGTLSVPVHALGLGELSSKSALNQNFNGDITLLSVRPEELDGVRVQLADQDAFKRAGVDRPFYLSLLKFEPTVTAKGKSVIRVTSEFPIREPFMNFLVEVNWPNGRLMREYTVLLDPPTTTKRRPPKVTAAAKTRKVTPAPAKQPAPVKKTTVSGASPAPSTASGASSAGSEYGPVEAYDTAWGIAKKVRPGGVSMEQMMMSLLDANPHAFIDGNINRLRKGRILRVPSRAEIEELSRAQARRAYREQQDQWLARRDQKLQSAAESEQAEAAIEASAADSAASEAAAQLKIATPRPEGEGEAGAGDDDAASPTANDIKSRLIVARENAETSRQEAATLRTQVDDLQARMENMQKLLSLKDDQLAQLQDRVATDALASSEMPVDAAEPEQESAAAPGAELPDAAEAEAVVEGLDVEEIPAQAGLDQMVEGTGVDEFLIQDIEPQVDPDLIVERAAAEARGELVTDEIVVGQDTADAEVVIEGEPPVETASAAVEAVTEPAQTEPAQTEPVAAEQPVVQEVATDAAAEATAVESSPPSPWVSMVEQNIVPIAVGGVSLLALFGWLATRGRRKEDDGPEPVIAAAAAEADVDAAVAAPEMDEPESILVDEPSMNADALSDLPDSSFLDEFSPSDINALQDETGEVDPVSEADVYIAYGRYQQAEEMLKQAMSRDPDRLALKHKLLEVHYATKNAGAFAVLAQEMIDSGQDAADEAAWTRAQDMGRELAPENALFAENDAETGAGLDEEVPGASAVATAVAAAAAGSVDSDTLALDDLDISELTSDFDEAKSSDEDFEAPSEVSITLDLDAPSGLSETLESELPEPLQLEDIEALDIELPMAEPEVVAGDAGDTLSDSLDLDSMMAEAEAAVDVGDSTLSLDSEFSADELQAQLDELSDLSILDPDPDETGASESVEAPAGLGLVEEDAGLAGEGLVDQPVNLDAAFDVAEGDEAGADILELADGADAGEAVDEDEVATKLDLARAYVEMGDEDGARAILEEVAAEGSQAQRGDAESLLSQLG